MLREATTEHAGVCPRRSYAAHAPVAEQQCSGRGARVRRTAATTRLYWHTHLHDDQACRPPNWQTRCITNECRHTSVGEQRAPEKAREQQPHMRLWHTFGRHCTSHAHTRAQPSGRGTRSALQHTHKAATYSVKRGGPRRSLNIVHHNCEPRKVTCRFARVPAVMMHDILMIRCDTANFRKTKNWPQFALARASSIITTSTWHRCMA